MTEPLHLARLACARFEEGAAGGAQGEQLLHLILDAKNALTRALEELQTI
ncbi:hypothetical protein [Aurantiacibacter luteus]|nr:hypothetical protein [Aurantiacibacter luteus]